MKKTKLAPKPRVAAQAEPQPATKVAPRAAVPRLPPPAPQVPPSPPPQRPGQASLLGGRVPWSTTEADRLAAARRKRRQDRRGK